MEVEPHALTRTKDHWWWRPGWGPGSRYFTFHLTFEDAGALHDASSTIAGRLDRAIAVDVVPVPWLHLTMTGVGFATDVDGPALEPVADEVFARSAQIGAEPLRFSRAFVYDEGFGIAPRPASWLGELKRIQARAVSRVRDTHQDAPFQPHVSLAYFSGDADIAGVEDAARSLPDEIVVARPQLSLIELGRDDRVYTWRVVRQASLG